MADSIPQPSDATISTSSGKGKLKWASNFGSKRTEEFKKAQEYVDSEVLRYCESLIPMQTGNLINSGKLGTELGSGEVRYTAPYAAYQYYRSDLDHSTNKNPQGGSQWFERMKSSHLSDIEAGVMKMF